MMKRTSCSHEHYRDIIHGPHGLLIGASYLARVLQYNTIQNKIPTLVICLVSITKNLARFSNLGALNSLLYIYIS
ncbi:hypothetical protein P8452_63461 [Trifolium repens]|nr:hypothetical protein P8452_63461 [Trifolium repens]